MLRAECLRCTREHRGLRVSIKLQFVCFLFVVSLIGYVIGGPKEAVSIALVGIAGYAIGRIERAIRAAWAARKERG